MSTHVDAPAPRNIAQETNDTLETQIRLAPSQLAAYQSTAPGYAATDINILGRSLFGDGFEGTLADINRRLTSEAAAQSRSANTAQREADLADVQRYGGDVLSLQRGANPELFGNLANLDAAAASPVTPGEAERAFSASALLSSGEPLSFTTYNPRMVGTGYIPTMVSNTYTPTNVSTAMTTPDSPTALESELERQAREELALGDSLSADEARQVRVQSRAAADARGRGFSNAALADEVLNSANARNARRDARRSFALTTNDALRSGQAADRGYALARDQFRAGIDQFNSGLGLSAAQLRSENDRFNSGLGLSAAQLRSENERFNSGLDFSAAQLNSGNRLAAAQFNASRVDADRAALDRAAQLEAARRGEDFGRQLSATQARLATFSDPFAGVLGRSSTNAGNNQTLFGNAVGTAGASAQQSRGMFDPFNSYAADLYNTNYNGAAAANIASANNRTALLGGAMKLVGSGLSLFGN